MVKEVELCYTKGSFHLSDPKHDSILTPYRESISPRHHWSPKTESYSFFGMGHLGTERLGTCTQFILQCILSVGMILSKWCSCFPSDTRF